MKVKNLKNLQNQVDTKKGQQLSNNQLSQVCGGNVIEGTITRGDHADAHYHDF